MKIAILLLTAFATLLAAEQTQTFAGRITDTMCGAHHTMMGGQPDEKCVRACVKGTSSQYALYDGKSVMSLSDQKTSARFAGKSVKVSGTYNDKTKTIKVASMEADN